MSSPFWIKINSCPPECDKKGLMHEVGTMFEGVLRSEVIGDVCQIKVQLNVKKPLWRGVFVQVDSNEEIWLPFKYENLPEF